MNKVVIHRDPKISDYDEIVEARKHCADIRQAPYHVQSLAHIL